MLTKRATKHHHQSAMVWRRWIRRYVGYIRSNEMPYTVLYNSRNFDKISWSVVSLFSRKKWLVANRFLVIVSSNSKNPRPRKRGDRSSQIVKLRMTCTGWSISRNKPYKPWTRVVYLIMRRQNLFNNLHSISEKSWVTKPTRVSRLSRGIL